MHGSPGLSMREASGAAAAAMPPCIPWSTVRWTDPGCKPPTPVCLPGDQSLVLPEGAVLPAPGVPALLLLPGWFLPLAEVVWSDWLEPRRPSLRLRVLRQVLNSSENFW